MTTQPDYQQFLRSLGSETFAQLRPSQESVLQTYAGQFTDVADVAVELPTGAGKTLIALLIAERWRQDGRKATILTANKTLARQMLAEAEEVGIPAVLMQGSGSDIPNGDRRAFQRATKVAIMNYWVYFNQRPVIDPADLVVMDDAHLAEQALHSLYSLAIDRYNHTDLYTSVVNELHSRYPEYTVLSDATIQDSAYFHPPELMSFIDQIEVSQRLREIIDASPSLQDDPDLRFRWHAQ